MNIKVLIILSQLVILQGAAGFSKVSNPSCGLALDVQSFIFLDRFCDDFYNIYREVGAYHECRANCYDNDFFFYCLEILLVPQETRNKAAAKIREITEPIYP